MREDAGVTETKVELLLRVSRVLLQQAKLVQTVCGWSRRYHNLFLHQKALHPLSGSIWPANTQMLI